MQASADAQWMTRALEIASKGLGETWPNPSVGCVLVRDGVTIGEGRTARGGRPHAETTALGAVDGASNGAHAYVTLEPCAHHGQTPPCARALIDAGIQRVVIAAVDPDPRVNRRGIALLRAANIDVVTDVCGEASRDLLVGFFHKVRTGRPLVISGSSNGGHYDARVDARLRTDPTVRRLEGLAQNGRLELRAPTGTHGMALLKQLGHHGLTSIFVPSDDPLAVRLDAEGLLGAWR